MHEKKITNRIFSISKYSCFRAKRIKYVLTFQQQQQQKFKSQISDSTRPRAHTHIQQSTLIAVYSEILPFSSSASSIFFLCCYKWNLNLNFQEKDKVSHVSEYLHLNRFSILFCFLFSFCVDQIHWGPNETEIDYYGKIFAPAWTLQRSIIRDQHCHSNECFSLACQSQSKLATIFFICKIATFVRFRLNGVPVYRIPTIYLFLCTTRKLSTKNRWNTQAGWEKDVIMICSTGATYNNQ